MPGTGRVCSSLLERGKKEKKKGKEKKRREEEERKKENSFEKETVTDADG